MLILLHNLSAFFSLQGNGGNLVFEPARFDRAFGFLLGTEGKLILLFAANLVLFGQNLGRFSHDHLA